MVLSICYFKRNFKALLVVKRSYNPPTRKSWSKQHPDFRTRRPLVEPYNLGRLHPEKEWWKLPQKGLSLQTFMGFPDVAQILKRGGALYTHLMDGHTLTMVVYRCLEKNIDDVTIWNRLSMQALKLAMSLDPYIVSLLFLYFSRSTYYDYKFVATFTGRVLATLDQFKLLECANVLMAMENDKFMHESTRERVIRHAEIVCLTGARSIPVEDSLRFISAINGVPSDIDHILVALCEIIEMADLSTADEDCIVDALYQSCALSGRIDRLCVNKMFDEMCDRLEREKECKHSRNIALLNAMATFKYRRPLCIEIIQDRLKGNEHTANIVELCRYMSFSSRIYYPLSTTRIRSEAIKSIDKLIDDPYLGIQYLEGCLKSSTALESNELKLLVDVVEKLDDISRGSVLDLYRAVTDTKTVIWDDFKSYVERLVKHAWNMLPDLSARETCCLMHHGNISIDNIVERSMVDEAFRRVSEEVDALTGDELDIFIRFCAKDHEMATKLLKLLEGKEEVIPRCGTSAVALLDVYERIEPDPKSKVYLKMLDVLASGRRVAGVDKRHRERLQQLIHGISHSEMTYNRCTNVA